MNFVQQVFKKYRVIAGDVIHLTQIPKFKKGLEKRERQEHNRKVLEEMRKGKGQQLQKTGSEDLPAPTKISKIDWNAPAKIKATTLSVIMARSKEKEMPESCNTYLSIRNKGGAEETANLTLRFDQEEYATLCGYPRDFAVWDEHTDPYADESMTMEEWVDDTEDFPENIVAYISRESEKEIFKQLKVSIQKQFADPKWKDSLTDKARKKVLNMMDKAIQRL